MKSPALASLALASMALPAMAAAHDLSSTPVVAPGNTLLNISADGRSSRKPDMAVFNAGVTTQGKTAGEAMAANSAASRSIRSRLSSPSSARVRTREPTFTTTVSAIAATS